MLTFAIRAPVAKAKALEKIGEAKVNGKAHCDQGQ